VSGRLTLLAMIVVVVSGCGNSGDKPGALADGSVPATPRAVSVGEDARFRPAPGAHAVRGLRCDDAAVRREGAHLELFAAGRIVVLPAGIGIAPPLRRAGAYVTGGRCSFPLRTREPTGVIEIAPGATMTLGALFALWGKRLDPSHLVSFQGHVRAWVDGTRVYGDPATIVLRRHAQIVVLVGPGVPVHATYEFPSGL
jgi:hypothetical protein